MPDPSAVPVSGGKLKEYPTRPDHLLVGVMSGTSLDGVDAVLVAICSSGAEPAPLSLALRGHVYLPYSPEVRSILLDLCSAVRSRIDALVLAHSGLGEWYAAAVRRLLASTDTPAGEVDAICMHGQTVWHAPLPASFPGPDGPIPVTGTLQIGCAAVVRERTGIPVISDFRSADMAAGGEGAPLAPFVDALLFGSADKGRVVQNLGGIGNATVIPPGATSGDIVAFDTGPGNMVIDAVVDARTAGSLRYDDGGAIAARGRVDETVIRRYMEDPWYVRTPPKSTGREVYGADFVGRFVSDCSAAGLGFEDTVATATALTAETIARAMRDFVLPRMRLDELVACGGGAKNPTLLRMIGQRTPGRPTVLTTADFGIPEDTREAIAFAVMGHESLMGRPGNLPAVTGASRPAVLGSVTMG